MTHIVTDNCSGCRYTECATVCPVECFHIDENMTYINPKLCIDCGACVPVCPVEAIFDEFDLPDDKAEWAAINIAKSAELPILRGRLDPLPTAETRSEELGF